MSTTVDRPGRIPAEHLSRRPHESAGAGTRIRAPRHRRDAGSADAARAAARETRIRRLDGGARSRAARRGRLGRHHNVAHFRAQTPAFRSFATSIPRWTSIWSALKRADADIYYVSGVGMMLGLVAMFARRYGRKFVYRLASTSDCHPDTIHVRLWRDKKLYAHGLKRADLVLSQTSEQQTADAPELRWRRAWWCPP